MTMASFENTAFIRELLRSNGDSPDVTLLAPIDVEDCLELVAASGERVKVAMLDPWYNKGIGGERDDYVEYILRLVELTSRFSEHIYLWGFPEIVASFVDKLPDRLELVAWLTWFYKNNPSVIRGWRSSQMTCLHLATEEHTVYPEHFLNEAQLAKKAEKKLRYMPGPMSVLESPLQIGFVGRKEQTGHKAQKPTKVFEPLIQMVTKPGDLIFDPMAGSGTSGAVARLLGRRALLSDHSEEYTQMMEARLEIERSAHTFVEARRPAPVESAVPRSSAAALA
jgi:site-specific DNA-methyltransferase (adenine-specific)